MTKKSQLKLCNYLLLAVIPTALASSLILEAGGGADAFGLPFAGHVWLHVAVCTGMLALVGWHLFLHFGKSGWGNKVKRLKSPVTRTLVWLTIVLLISAATALPHWMGSGMQHTTWGGVHGKIGFLFLLVAIGHTVKRWRWFGKA